MKPELSFNWIDLLSFVILVRILYIGVKSGFVVEFFKLTATFLGLFFSFHFYIKTGNFILKYLHFLGKDGGYFLSFILIYSLVWLVVRYIRVVMMLLFKIETHALVERWFCLLLSFFRGVVFISIFFFNVYLLDISYLDKSLEDSLSFPLLRNIAPFSYRTLGKGFRKIFPNLEINQQIDKVYEAE